ncbi:popeye domain-containing protein 3-like [Gigantopelta aegis]|uniref:popeye domain-containing protein 3-like n=1 Tax=Gigantopelta aegis TaxID=1735272 RepID=UPI001B88D09B|nr:popeye domain-containing protein 3-like [Gigantopelta aegis]
MENGSHHLSPTLRDNSTFHFILDVGYTNLSQPNQWPRVEIGCTTWGTPSHMLFQVANAVIAVGLCAPDTSHGVIFMHSFFSLGFLLMSVWSWVIVCAPDFFSWNFTFLVVNTMQVLFLMYHARPVKFCEELEELYCSTFQPLRVPRSAFKKLVCPTFCFMMTLHKGEAYCTQSITKTDKLGFLLSGVMNVYSNRIFLHSIKTNQFMDSPEFQSSVTGDEKYQVSIIAASVCRYIFWPRESLEYLLIKEPYLASIFKTMLGRDITNKLYALNEKVVTPRGSHYDIRIPSVSCSMRARQDLRKAVAGVPHPETDSPEYSVHTPSKSPRPSGSDSEEYTDAFPADTETSELLNGHVRWVLTRNQSGSQSSSHGSVNSGLQMNLPL